MPHSEPAYVAELQSLLRELAFLQGTPFANVQRMDWRSRCLSIVAQQGFPAPVSAAFQTVRVTEGTVCARAAWQRRPLMVEDIMSDRRFAPYRQLAGQAGFRSVLSIPLITRSGALIGVMSTHFAKASSLGKLSFNAMQQSAEHATRALFAEQLRQSQERPFTLPL